MASYPSTPVAFPTRLIGSACHPSHWNLMTDEVAALELALMAPSAETNAAVRPRGLALALEWGHNTPGYGSVLGHGYGSCGSAYLLSGPGSNAGTVRTRGNEGSILGVDADGTFLVAVTPSNNADNQTPREALALTQAGALRMDGQGRMMLETQTGQVLPSGVWTDIGWSNELSDPQGFHNTNSVSLVIPVGMGGVYLVTLRLALAGTGTMGLGFNRVSGSGTLGRVSSAIAPPLVAGAGTDGAIQHSLIWPLAAGDISTMQAFSNGAADTVQAYTYVEFVRLWGV